MLREDVKFLIKQFLVKRVSGSPSNITVIHLLQFQKRSPRVIISITAINPSNKSAINSGNPSNITVIHLLQFQKRSPRIIISITAINPSFFKKQGLQKI